MLLLPTRDAQLLTFGEGGVDAGTQPKPLSA